MSEGPKFNPKDYLDTGKKALNNNDYAHLKGVSAEQIRQIALARIAARNEEAVTIQQDQAGALQVVKILNPFDTTGASVEQAPQPTVQMTPLHQFVFNEQPLLRKFGIKIERASQNGAMLENDPQKYVISIPKGCDITYTRSSVGNSTTKSMKNAPLNHIGLQGMESVNITQGDKNLIITLISGGGTITERYTISRTPNRLGSSHDGIPFRAQTPGVQPLGSGNVQITDGAVRVDGDGSYQGTLLGYSNVKVDVQASNGGTATAGVNVITSTK